MGCDHSRESTPEPGAYEVNGKQVGKLENGYACLLFVLVKMEQVVTHTVRLAKAQYTPNYGFNNVLCQYIDMLCLLYLICNLMGLYNEYIWYFSIGTSGFMSCNARALVIGFHGNNQNFMSVYIYIYIFLYPNTYL